MHDSNQATNAPQIPAWGGGNMRTGNYGIALASNGTENPVTTARNRILEAIKRIVDIRDRVESIANVQLGQQPPVPSSPTTGMASREGEAGRLHDDLDTLHGCLDSLLTQVIRMEPLGVQTTPPLAPEFLNNPRRIG